MKTADLITSYLSNEMTPEQERQFLLSVAASDSLRLSLKSHFMLDKIVAMQAMDAHVPEALRTAILSQASESVDAAGARRPQAPGSGTAARAASGFGRMFGRGAVMALMVASGFAAGFFTRSEVASEANVPVTAPSQVSRQTESPAVDPAALQSSTTPVEASTPTTGRTDADRQASLVAPGQSGNNTRPVQIERTAPRINRNAAQPVRSETAVPTASNTSTSPATVNAGSQVDGGNAPRNNAEVDVQILKPGQQPGAQHKQEGGSTP